MTPSQPSLSEGPAISERDAIKRERQAVMDAVHELRRQNRLDFSSGSWEGSLTLAERLYPLPKVTRPRVVEDKANGREIRLTLDGYLQSRFGKGHEWHSLTINQYVAENRPALADLLSNPLETVEDDQP